MPEWVILRFFFFLIIAGSRRYKGTDAIFRGVPTFYPDAFSFGAGHNSNFETFDLPEECELCPSRTDDAEQDNGDDDDCPELVIAAARERPKTKKKTGARKSSGTVVPTSYCSWFTPALRSRLGWRVATGEPLPPLEPAEIHVVVRGKEMALACGKLLFMAHFKTHGHGNWMPNEVADPLIAQGLFDFSLLGKSFPLTPAILEFSRSGKWDPNLSGEPTDTKHIRILLSIRGKTHTLYFADHQGFMGFRVTLLSRDCTAADLAPGGPLWPYIWDRNHGGDWLLEPEVAKNDFDQWLDDYSYSDETLYSAMHDQMCANGLGSWLISDVLAWAVLHGSIPMRIFVRQSALVERLFSAITGLYSSYDVIDNGPNEPLTFKSSLPYVLENTKGPFAFNEHGNELCLNAVLSYRKGTVIVRPDQYNIMLAGNLLRPGFVLQDDMTAVWPYKKRPVPPLPKGFDPTANNGNKTLANYTFPLSGGTYYTGGIACSVKPEWRGLRTKSLEKLSGNAYDKALDELLLRPTPVPDSKDVKFAVNTATLGFYSFRAFVQNRKTKLVTTKMGRPRKNRSTSKGGRPGKELTNADIKAMKSKQLNRRHLSARVALVHGTDSKENVPAGILTRAQRKKAESGA